MKILFKMLANRISNIPKEFYTMTNWGLSQGFKVGQKCISIIHHVLRLKKINRIILMDGGKAFNKNLPTIHEGKKCQKK